MAKKQAVKKRAAKRPLNDIEQDLLSLGKYRICSKAYIKEIEAKLAISREDAEYYKRIIEEVTKILIISLGGDVPSSGVAFIDDRGEPVALLLAEEIARYIALLEALQPNTGDL